MSNDHAQQTKYNRLVCLRWWLNFLATVGAVAGLSALVPQVARPAPRDVTVSADELRLLLDLALPWEKLALLLLHDAGLRSGTARRVVWADVQGDCLVKRTKRGAVTRVPLSGRLREILAIVPKGTLPLLVLARGKPVGENTWLQSWRALMLKAGIERRIIPHDCRRSMAREVYELTGDLRVAQQLLGHNRLSSTLHYLESEGGEAALHRAVHEVTTNAKA